MRVGASENGLGSYSPNLILLPGVVECAHSRQNMVTYAVLAGVSFLVVVVLTPLVARLATALKAVDEPGQRKIHSKPTPRLGGVAIFAAVFLPSLAVLCLGGEDTRRICALFGATLAILLLGAADDLKGSGLPSSCPSKSPPRACSISTVSSCRCSRTPSARRSTWVCSRGR